MSGKCTRHVGIYVKLRYKPSLVIVTNAMKRIIASEGSTDDNDRNKIKINTSQFSVKVPKFLFFWLSFWQLINALAARKKATFVCSLLMSVSYGQVADPIDRSGVGYF